MLISARIIEESIHGRHLLKSIIKLIEETLNTVTQLGDLSGLQNKFHKSKHTEIKV